MQTLKKQPPRLGRGLSALLSQEEEIENLEEMLVLLSPECIETNPFQPRTVFDDVSLEELARSIQENGVLQPILVKKKPDGSYELIAGERRLRAAKRIKAEKIPCRVMAFSDEKSLEIAILENIQREDLNVIEEGLGYHQLMKKFNYTQETIAQKVGKSRSYIANILRLLTLPESVKRLIQDEKLSPGHAKSLINTENPEKMAQSIIEHQWTVRQIEEEVRNQKERKKIYRPLSEEQIEEMQIARQISDVTGIRTKVQMRKGEVVFYIKDLDKLETFIDRICEAFKKTQE